MWGTGSPLRQFTYSRDCARFVLKILDDYEKYESVICTGNIYSNIFTVVLIKMCWESSVN